jgi:2-C-methyl-D-erythritol 2,4-cyclodiphosphate synthase
MVGFGYDSHRLEVGRKLIIGGVDIESSVGAVAHSDGDVLLHALCDALLGAAGLGDIGMHFPDSDLKYKDADSSIFVNKIMQMLSEKSYKIINIDATVLLEKIRLSPYKDPIKRKIAELCNLSNDKVNIKAKTNEGMGFVGTSEGIAAYCICEIQNFQSI